MPWDYLENPVLQVRQRIAAHFLQGCEKILEIGAFKSPITSFLLHQPKEVVVIDPLTEPLELSELNGQPCRIRHLAITLDQFTAEESWERERFGLVFCGMDLNRQEDTPDVWLDTVCKFLSLVSRAQPAVLEYPIQWQNSIQLFNLILSLLQPRIAADIRLDLTRFPQGPEFTDEIRTRFLRRLVVLADMEPMGTPKELRERVGRILFGSSAAEFILETTALKFQEVPEAMPLASVQRAHDKAHVEFKDGVILVTTPPDAWFYGAFVPFAEVAAARLSGSSAIPASLDVDITVTTGQVGVGVIHQDFTQILGERLVRVENGHQRIRLFIPDIREHIGLICRNGQSGETISRARILRVALLLPG
jgi:hypothetical protein